MAKSLYYLASAPCDTDNNFQPQLCTHATLFVQALLLLVLSYFISSTWMNTLYFSTIHHPLFPYLVYSNSVHPS